MTRRFPLSLLGAAALLTLAGCFPTTMYYRAGATVDGVRGDEVACGRLALAQAPVEKEREIIPGEWIPGAVRCDEKNRCRRDPPFRTPPRVIVYDVNEDLRSLIARQCMAEKGYDRISLPACSDGVAAQVTPAVTRTLPRLNDKACVIRRGGGNFQVVPLVTAG